MFRFARICRTPGLLALWGLCAGLASAQGIWRCGNDYTNHPDPARNCTPVTNSTVTVIEGTRVQQRGAPTAPAAPAASTAPTPAGASPAKAQIPAAEQQQRDLRARQILQAELERVQAQQRGLRHQWGQADEAEKKRLRPMLERVDADVAALQREITP